MKYDSPQPGNMHDLQEVMNYTGPTEEISVTNSQPPNWFTQQGVWKMAKQLDERMPDLKNGRFMTLTINQEFYDSPQEAYEKGKRHLCEFFYRLDKFLGRPKGKRTKYCWKLEFQENGWPHWHVLFLYRRKIDCLAIGKLWGKGRTEIKRIRNHKFSYLWKYMMKGEECPGWLKEYKQVRVFQSSKGFLLEKPKKDTPTDEAVHLKNSLPHVEPSPRPEHKKECSVGQKPRKESTLGERLRRWERTLKISSSEQTIIFEGPDGLYIELQQFAAQHVAESALMGDSRTYVQSTRITTERKELQWLLKQVNQHKTPSHQAA